MWLQLGMAALGALKGMGDVQKQKAQEQLASRTVELSPWTGLQAQPVQQASPFGDIMKYGLTGMGIENNMAQQAAQNKLLKAKTDYYGNLAGNQLEKDFDKESLAQNPTNSALNNLWGRA